MKEKQSLNHVTVKYLISFIKNCPRYLSMQPTFYHIIFITSSFSSNKTELLASVRNLNEQLIAVVFNENIYYAKFDILQDKQF